MRRYRTRLLMGICFSVFCGLLFWHIKQNDVAIAAFLQYDEHVFGIPCVSLEEISTGKEVELSEKPPVLQFEGVDIPFDNSSQTFYLAQDYESDVWEGKISLKTDTQGMHLFLENDPYWNMKKQAICDNHVFKIWIVDQEGYNEWKLIITGTPIISILTETTVEPEYVEYEEDPDKKYYGSELQYYGEIRVFDPGRNGGKYELSEMKVNYHKKGASTASFEKAGYSLSLLDNKQEKLDVSLLGMRSDNSWKLNALVTDSSKVREKTAAQLWEFFNQARPELNEAGPRMEYVELILDGDYRGIYCLVEPVDEKKLGLDENDVLYKVIEWNPPSNEDIQYAIDKKWKIMYPIRIRYPKVISDYSKVWGPVTDYLNVFYREALLEQEELEARVNKDNLFDMVMFTMAVSGSDNSFKNTYYVAEVGSTGSYTMKQIPWDLDLTFGNVYEIASPNISAFDPEYDKVYVENAFWGIRNANPEQIKTEFFAKWTEYRQSFLSVENISKLLTDNRDYLLQTGAITREEKRWQEETDKELNEVLEYVDLRLQWLDGYFCE